MLTPPADLPKLQIPVDADPLQQAEIAIDWGLSIIGAYGETAGNCAALIEWAKDDGN